MSNKMKFKKLLNFKMLMAIVIIGMLGLNLGINMQDSSNGSKISLKFLKNMIAYGQEGSTTSYGTCHYIEYHTLGQHIYVTEITGDAAVEAGIQVGMRWRADWSTDIQMALKAGNMNDYKRECFDGGKCACTNLDWTMCPTDGCPVTQGMNKC